MYGWYLSCQPTTKVIIHCIKIIIIIIIKDINPQDKKLTDIILRLTIERSLISIIHILADPIYISPDPIYTFRYS